MNAAGPASTSFRTLAWLLFLPLLTYLLLRAWYVEPLHDEAATFFHYIETGEIWGPGSLLDANNHLLNSYLGRGIYLLFGESMFLFRLPNVLAFVLFFWAAFVIARKHTQLLQKMLVLTALVTVHYIFDYFGFTRGYGLAIAFFLWAFIYLDKWNKEQRPLYLFALYLFLLLAIFSNLTYLVTGCLSLVFVLFVQALHLRTIPVKRHLILGLLHALFLVGLYPMIKFSLDLKAGGALYYGSLDGFWNVTGDTLSQVVLFYHEKWLKYVAVLGMLAFVAWLVLQLRKRGFWEQWKQTETVAAYLIFGNIVAIFFLAKVMLVNYPSDRAAMYFIPLVIIAFSECVFSSRRLQLLGLALLWFPLSFLWKLNLCTSIFSPDDRMNTAFYDKVMAEVDDETTVTLYPIMQLVYPLHERHFAKLRDRHIALSRKPFVPCSDIIVSKTSWLTAADDLSEYRVIAQDKPSTHIAFERKKPFKKILIFDTLVPAHSSDGEFIPIYTGKLSPAKKGYYVQTSIRGEVVIDTCYQTMDLVIATFDKAGAVQRYDYVNLRWYEGERTLKFPVNWQYAAGEWAENEEEVRIYIWNPQHSKVSFNRGKVRMYKLN